MMPTRYSGLGGRRLRGPAGDDVAASTVVGRINPLVEVKIELADAGATDEREPTVAGLDV